MIKGCAMTRHCRVGAISQKPKSRQLAKTHCFSEEIFSIFAGFMDFSELICKINVQKAYILTKTLIL